jgi:dTDP-4-dehydrorhamnose 3,5-epimerase
MVTVERNEMRKLPTKLEGPIPLEPVVHGDQRGFFLETYRRNLFAELGLADDFVQDNHSRFRGGIVRGMHFQPGMAKLVRCMRGAILDVLVDIRRGSPAFGRWEAVELNDSNRHQLYCPDGFGHGFCVPSDVADVVYRCTAYYDPEREGGFAFDDAEVGIAWPSGVELVGSRRDAGARGDRRRTPIRLRRLAAVNAGQVRGSGGPRTHTTRADGSSGILKDSMRQRLAVNPVQYRRVTHITLVALTLIVLTSAAVRLTGSGLGCPNWPKCYGPALPRLSTHALIEFSNRTLSALVGVVTIVAAVLAFTRRPFRRDLARLALLLPLGVVGQAVLGGFTVREPLAPGFVMAHFGLSMIVLIAAVALAWRATYEPSWRPRSTDRWSVWSVHALAPLGALTIFAGPRPRPPGRMPEAHRASGSIGCTSVVATR